MKKLSISLLAAAIATGLASAQTAYTTPVGYVTTAPLAPNQFNLISLTVHNSMVAAGVIDAAAPNSITDNGVNFTTLLGASSLTSPTYILELPNGVIQEITSWSGSVLTTPDDITPSVVPGTTTYMLRKAATISEVFGASNSAGLTPSVDGETTSCDTIQLFNGSGFDIILYINDGEGTEGWFTSAFAPAEDIPILHPDGFFVRRVAGSPINLVVTGEVKLSPTSGLLATGFNYLGSVAPVGLTLGNSGLENFITQSPDGEASTADTVQVPLPNGSYLVCLYINDGEGTEGWFTSAFADATNVSLEGGFLIQNRGANNRPYTLSVPTSYNNL